VYLCDSRLRVRMPRARALAGADERDQLAQIFRLLGTPLDADSATPAASAIPASSSSAPVSASDSASGGATWGTGREVSAFATIAAMRASKAAAAAVHADAPLTAATTGGMIAGNLWPGVSRLPGFVAFDTRAPQPWHAILPISRFPNATPLAVDLLRKMLTLDPRRRITAAEALAHPWWDAAPLPCPPSSLPLPTSAYKHR